MNTGYFTEQGRRVMAVANSAQIAREQAFAGLVAPDEDTLESRHLFEAVLISHAGFRECDFKTKPNGAYKKQQMRLLEWVYQQGFIDGECGNLPEDDEFDPLVGAV